MKAIIGIFEDKETIKTAVIRLKEAGYGEDDLALLTSYHAEEVRDALAEHPEETAVSGALVGSGIGGVLGLLGGLSLAPMADIGLIAAYGFLGTLSGGTLGSYLGSIYATRAEDEPEHELKNALAESKLILLARVEESTKENTRAIMQQSGGTYLAVHEIDPQALHNM